MNRRQFLKRVGVVCAAAVVAPTTLVKNPQKFIIGSHDNYIQDERVKTAYDRWHEYYMGHNPPVDTELLDKLKDALKNTKFTPPFKVFRW